MPGRRGLLGGLAAAALAAGRAEAMTAERGTGDLGLVVERASGSVQIVETTGRSALGRITGLGDLSHASAVFSRDGRYAFVFGRDGGLNKIDLLQGELNRRVLQAGNSIGGAISDDGRLVAVGNYEPGGVRVFDSVTLEPVEDIPAAYGPEGAARSKVVGLADIPGRGFAFSLYDADEVWTVALPEGGAPEIRRFRDAGRQPYDGFVTPDGRHYIAGLFGEDGLTRIDLWHPERGVQRVLPGYGRGEEPLPVFKMPHLRGWAVAGEQVFLPAIGRHELLVADRWDWTERGRVAVHGQPVFAVARPDGRQVWVNFAHPRNDVVQVVDTESLSVVHAFTLGRGVMHLEFTPRGEQAWISVRDINRVEVFDTRSLARIASLPAESPSGILLTARAGRIGF
ncbi:cytochrome D1 domain-containing protein [Roseicella frigidaeris]|uniref:Protein nirF n=1 Tax=Roseicella frigidaeris TaxID=2230885 RepID=A0A327LWK1_9PROT|nr:cytochrome D1 domain-containing protein [Roseicella frigidaeris]RAI55191.1 protein nirF [Roseicella frigidaeris]